MAEFSKEYIETTGFPMLPDFSFKNEFKRLKEGYTSQVICEGFGNKAILKENGKNIVIMFGDVETTIDKLIEDLKDVNY